MEVKWSERDGFEDCQCGVERCWSVMLAMGREIVLLGCLESRVVDLCWEAPWWLRAKGVRDRRLLDWRDLSLGVL